MSAPQAFGLDQVINVKFSNCYIEDNLKINPEGHFTHFALSVKLLGSITFPWKIENANQTG